MCIAIILSGVLWKNGYFLKHFHFSMEYIIPCTACNLKTFCIISLLLKLYHFLIIEVCSIIMVYNAFGEQFDGDIHIKNGHFHSIPFSSQCQARVPGSLQQSRVSVLSLFLFSPVCFLTILLFGYWLELCVCP